MGCTSADPCWFGGSNFVYRADVTAYITGNGTYLAQICNPLAAGLKDSADPWLNSAPPLAEGASLVIVHEGAGTSYVYDAGLAGAMFIADPGLSWDLGGLNGAPAGLAKWFTIGADGQVGNSLNANPTDTQAMEITTLSTSTGVEIVAGPGSANSNSDWNGSDGNPLPQLWDSAGHDVSRLFPAGAPNTTLTVSVTVPPGGAFVDCLVPIANVVWLQ